MTAETSPGATVMAGIPALNASLYHRIRFLVGDPAAILTLPAKDGGETSILILRDIEMARARRHARADQVASPADFTPEGGLSGDRETATAQAVAECLCRAGVEYVTADRTLPLLFAEHIRAAGIEVVCDPDRGVLDRRAKDAQEAQWLREAQAVTEGAVQLACERIARAKAAADGTLEHEGAPLTAERVRAEVDVWLMQRGYANPAPIIAPGPMGADCHNLGSGPIRTGEPVLVDIFPRNRTNLYNGDCTRTVVHGEISEILASMHAAVRAAKAAAEAALRPGTDGEAVHRAVLTALETHGFGARRPGEPGDPKVPAMHHGTGHGVGLEVHEPPLLDFKGPALVVGDVVTIEPGLYAAELGGVRVEDMAMVTPGGCENFNRLPEGLDWR